MDDGRNMRVTSNQHPRTSHLIEELLLMRSTTLNCGREETPSPSSIGDDENDDKSTTSMMADSSDSRINPSFSPWMQNLGSDSLSYQPPHNEPRGFSTPDNYTPESKGFRAPTEYRLGPGEFTAPEKYAPESKRFTSPTKYLPKSRGFISPVISESKPRIFVTPRKYELESVEISTPYKYEATVSHDIRGQVSSEDIGREETPNMEDPETTVCPRSVIVQLSKTSGHFSADDETYADTCNVATSGEIRNAASALTSLSLSSSTRASLQRLNGRTVSRTKNIPQTTILDATLCRLYPEPKPRSQSVKEQTADDAPSYVQKPRSMSLDGVVSRIDRKRSESFSQTHLLFRKLGMTTSDSVSTDDGLGSSAGSSDSIDGLPNFKRKHGKKMFRCMWRGCHKQFTALSGIVSHVRDSHIGASSESGEEDFYFDDVTDDVNQDVRTTNSCKTSSDDSSSEDKPKSKYQRSFFSGSRTTPIRSAETKTKQKSKLIESKRLESKEVRKKQNIRKPRESSIQESYEIPKQQIEPDVLTKPEDTENKLYESELVVLPELAHPTEKVMSLNQISEHADESPIHDSLTLTIDTTQIDSTTFHDQQRSQKPLLTSATSHQPLHLSLDQCNESLSDRRTPDQTKKKCRKVYGMERRDLWCTQCRWKKACVRF